jgi:hypothetical protein
VERPTVKSALAPVFRPQPTIYLLWALGDEETRRVIEAAHERAIERVQEWIHGRDGQITGVALFTRDGSGT